jgi:hypothetical protein
VANAVLDPAPTRDDARAASWARWFHQLYAVVQNIFTGATFTNPTLAGAVTLPGSGVSFGSDWGGAWTPALTGGGAMTVSVTATYEASYYRIGGVVYFKYYAQVSFGGTAASFFGLTLPVAHAGATSSAVTCYLSANNTAWTPGFAYCAGASGSAFVSPQNNANFALGAQYVMLSGFYRG